MHREESLVESCQTIAGEIFEQWFRSNFCFLRDFVEGNGVGAAAIRDRRFNHNVRARVKTNEIKEHSTLAHQPLYIRGETYRWNLIGSAVGGISCDLDIGTGPLQYEKSVVYCGERDPFLGRIGFLDERQFLYCSWRIGLAYFGDVQTLIR